MVEQMVEPQHETQQPLDGELKWLPLDVLYESSWNPRQYYPEAAMAELVESMRSSGYREWLPLMVRPIPKENGLDQFDQQYEIGAGHRRSRAAREAGITSVPCIVRPMTDEQFLDVLNFDNRGREDVHPLHEAGGWQQWMEKTGKGVLDIAARIGQSKEYVYQRLKYGSLSDAAKKAFLDGEITAGHAILIARLQAPEQQKALKYCVTPDWRGHNPGVRDLATFIQRDVHLHMGNANFDLASSELLPAAGSCNACPKRTKNSPELLLGIEVAADPDADDCTDPGCFVSKVNAHLVQLKGRFEQEGKKLLKVSNAYGKAKKGSDYTRGDLQQISSKPQGGFEAAVWVDGSDAGKVIYVKPSPPKASASSGSSAKPDPEVAKRAEAARKNRIDLELSVRRCILDTIRSKVGGLSRVDVEVLLGDYLGQGVAAEDEMERLYPSLKNIYGPAAQKTIAKLSDSEIFQMAVILPLLEDFDEYRLINQPADHLLAAAKRYKVDAAKIRIQVEGAAKQAAESKPPADKKPPVVPPASKKAVAKKKAAKPAAKKKGNGK